MWAGQITNLNVNTSPITNEVKPETVLSLSLNLNSVCVCVCVKIWVTPPPPPVRGSVVVYISSLERDRPAKDERITSSYRYSNAKRPERLV